jgi:small subunit ribosomal protein S8
MSINDPIGDLLTRIRNGQERGLAKISAPASKLRGRVLDVLAGEGYIRGYAEVTHTQSKPEFEIELKYFDGKPVIKELKPVRNGLGISILSTPKGVMSDALAREQNVGGEILCHVF